MSDDAAVREAKPLPFSGGGGFAAATYAPSAGFRSDARFGIAPAAPPQAACEAEDPIAVSWAQGYLAGTEQAQAEAAGTVRIDAGARDKLALAFTRLDRDLEDELRQRLRDTVAALCEAALAPLALDEAALLRRIERAMALFARADDERVIRLHPGDLALVSPRLAKDWRILPDPALERGALRIEAENGGVEDGPAQWRLAIAEALGQ